MTAIAQTAQSNVATRLLAGVSVPDTALISRAIDFARERSEPYLFNHVMRSWLFAALKLYEGHYHDLLNDIDKEIVMADINDWIDARVPAIRTKPVAL